MARLKKTIHKEAVAADPRDHWKNMQESNRTFEPTTCATAHLASERALRLLERLYEGYGEGPLSEAISTIRDLCMDAGPEYNKAALTINDRDDPVPF